jgi:hypothetical protein
MDHQALMDHYVFQLIDLSIALVVVLIPLIFDVSKW